MALARWQITKGSLPDPRDLQEAPQASSPKLDSPSHPHEPMKNAEKGGFWRLEHRLSAHRRHVWEIVVFFANRDISPVNVSKKVNFIDMIH